MLVYTTLWVIQILSWLLYFYIMVLLARVLLDWLRFFIGEYRPPGILLFVANFVYAITDPPVDFFGRLIPPLRLGAIALDMGFLVFFFVLYLANYVLRIIAVYIASPT